MVKELLIETLGPLGESEFNLLKQTGIKYKNVLESLTKLKNQGIIDEIALKNIDYRLMSVFEIKKKKEDKKVDVPSEIRKLLISQFGPMGEFEFDIINKKGINYNIILDHLDQLKEKKIIEENNYKEFVRKLGFIFPNTKKKINIPETIRKIYFELLGPMGGIEFKRLGTKVNTKTVVLNINQLEKGGILKAADASRFRDTVISLLS